jgi:hypothetical protein
MRVRAAARGTRIVPDATAGLSPAAANEAIALAACEAAGLVVPPTVSLATESGAAGIARLRVHGKQLGFVNAFACNDVISLGMLWREHATGDSSLVALLNHRGDRPLRSLQFLDYFAALPERPRILLLGSSAWLRREAHRRGLDFGALASPPWAGGAALLQRVAAAVSDGTTLWGVGNYHGRGAALVRAIRQEATCSS